MKEKLIYIRNVQFSDTLNRKIFCRKLIDLTLGKENFKVFWTAFPTFKSSGDDSSPVNSMVCLYIPEI